MCAHGRCTTLLPGHVKEKSTYQVDSVSGIDLSKMTPSDVENVSSSAMGRQAVMKAGFGRYLDEIRSEIKKAPSEERKQHLTKLMHRQVLPKYNKYHGTNYKT